MHPDAPLWVSLLLLPAFAARGVWRVLRSGDGLALAMLIASWFALAIGFKLLRPSLAVSALWLPCFYPYLWQGVFAGGWLLCRPDPLALPARQVLASDALALALGHLGVLAGGLFSQDIRHAYWYRPAAMTLVFWLASLLLQLYRVRSHRNHASVLALACQLILPALLAAGVGWLARGGRPTFGPWF